uniref:Ig-like domain-containing protein n=1 Tax=Amphiprion percula TaxID=161767 RepID=A0A3P8RRR2_AMPPE
MSLSPFTFAVAVVLVKSLGEDSGYLGDTITLKSGVNPAWNLSRIEWLIWPNRTWIVTYRQGKTNTERVNHFGQRLSLNTSSGDLTIRNLTKDDAMEYTVDLHNTDNEEKVNKINLTVRERLQKPTIQAASRSVKGKCLMVLDCSSTDNGVNHSWDVTPSSVYTTDRSSARLLAIFNSTQNSVNFTCTTTNNIDHARSVVTLKCDGDKIQPPTPESLNPQPRQKFAFPFLTGCLVGAFIVIIIYCFGGKKKTPPLK